MSNSLRSPLGRVRGLGSAKSGVDHWWRQRLTALALAPLVTWFVVGLVAHAGADQAVAAAWIGAPLNATLLLLLLIAGFWHLQLGGRVIIEDYVHAEGPKFLSLVVLNFATIAVGLACVVAVLKLALRTV
jgi:succinate dehydrogenase / fumarate reductase membrane anchor subunit